jgi:predicted enzyme related to lactoylglutathione lyase
MTYDVSFGDIVIDCRDAKKLCGFYAGLTGWETGAMFGLPTLGGKTAPMFLFSQEDDYVRPVWPEVEGKQQKQLHIDFQVPDVEEAVKRALKLGAVKTEAQFGGDDWTTMLDPEGHPFCLCRKD